MMNPLSFTVGKPYIMTTIQTALEFIRPLAATRFLDAYISNVGFGRPVICISPENDGLNPLLVLACDNGLRIVRHRTEELTEEHRSKKVSKEWVEKFIEFNGGEQYKKVDTTSSDIQSDIPEIESWRDWHH